MIALFNKKNKIAADTQRFLSSSVLANLVNFAKSIVTANLLGPYWTGLCLSFMSIPQTVNYFNFGLTDTLQVKAPQLSNKDELFKLRGLLLNYAVYMSGLFFILVVCYIVIFPSHGFRLDILILMAGAVIVLEQVRKFFYTDYVAEKRFTKLSWLEFILSVMTLLLTVVAIYFLGVYGYWIGIIIPYLFFIIYAFNDYKKKNDIRLGRLDVKSLFSLLPLGIAMMLSSVVYTPFIITAKLFLAFAMGAKEVGLFMLSIMLIAKVSMIPKAISGALMPHMSQRHSRDGHLASILSIFVKAQIYSLLISSVAVVVGYFLLEPVVRLILPEYLLGVPAAKVFIFACIPYCLLDNANTVLIVSQNKRPYLWILGFAFFAQLLILWFFYIFNLTIYNVALTYLIVFMIYAVLIHAKIYQLWRKETPVKTPLFAS